MQICVGEQHTRVLDQWLEDLVEVCETVRKNPNIKVDS